MNDIINWIALNDTLMIRIGFSAVVLLLVVYVFRFFFMPNISVVENTVKTESGVKSSDMNIEELAELQTEVDTLKVKLKELQNQERKTEAQPAAAAAGAGTGGLDTVSSSPSAPSPDESAAKELKEKIKVLESRLTEYEIIAEEIAEIGKLKQENQQLKEKLQSGPAAGSVKVSEELNDESLGTVNSDKEIDDLLGAALEATPEEASAEQASEAATVEGEDSNIEVASNETAALEEIAVSGKVVNSDKPELFILHSDVEVTEEEKELINSFEDYKKVQL